MSRVGALFGRARRAAARFAARRAGCAALSRTARLHRHLVRPRPRVAPSGRRQCGYVGAGCSSHIGQHNRPIAPSRRAARSSQIDRGFCRWSSLLTIATNRAASCAAPLASCLPSFGGAEPLVDVVTVIATPPTPRPPISKARGEPSVRKSARASARGSSCDSLKTSLDGTAHFSGIGFSRSDARRRSRSRAWYAASDPFLP